MRVIRASEIGAYAYCRKAWWHRLQGVQSENQTEMDAGTAYHAGHGGQVVMAGLLRFVAWLALLAALAFIAAAVTRMALGA